MSCVRLLELQSRSTLELRDAARPSTPGHRKTMESVREKIYIYNISVMIVM